MKLNNQEKLTRKEIICKVSVAYFLLIKKFTEKVKIQFEHEEHNI
jgi:hypothetical protein